MQLHDDRELVASLEVVVVKQLHSSSPLLTSNMVLLAPGASFQLATNMDDEKIVYRSYTSCIALV
jgi:hypothetical protein